MLPRGRYVEPPYPVGDKAPNHVAQQSVFEICLAHPDTTAKIAALLRDLAAVQDSKPSRWGFKRAAATVLGLDDTIESYMQPDGSLRKIPYVG